MRRKNIVIVLLFSILVMLFPTDIAKAGENKELNIYAMYLGDGEKGESALLESKGHYLLVDIGAASHAPIIVGQLNRLGVTHVDVMLSHLHSDHIASSGDNITAGLDQLHMMGITIDTLYLPAKTLAPYSKRFPYRYAQLERFMSEQGSGKIVYLDTGNIFQFGDVSAQVVGPVDSWKLSPNQFTQYADEEDRYVVYENNCSLAVIFTCGSTRYFTAGDSYGAEAEALVEAYGDALSCDIMKLCHHGIGTGNSAELLKAINPSYSYVPNSGVANVNATTGRWRSYAATKRASKYGLCYMLGSEEQTLIYHIVNDNITLYRGSTLSGAKKLTGWQYLYGADGLNRDHDMYYLDSDCNPTTGTKKIGSHYYHFTAGGQMEYGSYSEDGTYLEWKTYTNGRRHYTLSSNEKYAYMSVGFDTVDGMPMYFDKNGYSLVSDTDDSITVTKIGSAYYAVDFEGELTVSDWEEIDGLLYYFDSTGKMLRGCERKINGSYYLFDTDGSLYMGNGRTEFYDVGSNTYAVREDGTLVTNKCGKIDGDKYYFDSKGVMQKNKIIKIGKKKYYFGKNGKMVYNKTFTYNGKKYRSNEKGVVTEA